MHDILTAVISGLDQLLTWPTPLYLFAGVAIGYVVGILPGLGGPAAMAFLLPVVIPLLPLQGFVLLTAAAAVTTGAGDMTSILFGIPGEATAAAIVADGHALARRGEGGRAAGAAISASLLGSLLGICALVALVPIAQPILKHVQSPELTMLALLGIGLLVPLSHAQPVKGLLAGTLGLTLATVGVDPSFGEPRFTFGQLSLWDGLGLLTVALGIYAVPEVLESIRGGDSDTPRAPAAASGLARGLREALSYKGLIARCSAIGAAIGILPGVGASVSQWIAYAHAGASARVRGQMGRGAIEGVIGPASATTATFGGALVPTLALGIPGSLTTSFLLSALILKGIIPGPTMLMPESAGGHLALVFSLVWCVVIAAAIGALISVVSLGWIVRLAGVRPSRLFPAVLMLILIGTVGERHAPADLGILVAVGVIGYVLTVLKWPRAPMMLGFVLGPLVERRLMLSHDIYGWSWLLRPAVVGLMAVAIVFLVIARRSSRETASPAHDGRAGSIGDVVVSAAIAGLAVFGLLQTRAMPSHTKMFPVLAFGATLILAAIALIAAVRRHRGGWRFSAFRIDGAHLVRLGWLAVFAGAAWSFGLVAGTLISTPLFLRREARESWLVTAAMTGVLGVVALLLVQSLMHLTDQGALLWWW